MERAGLRAGALSACGAKPRIALDWRRLADTITLNAVQQQEWTSERYPAHEVYPDAFSIVKGAEEYHCTWNRVWWRPVLPSAGSLIESKTVIARRGA